jgi:hypothetical protein
VCFIRVLANIGQFGPDQFIINRLIAFRFGMAVEDLLADFTTNEVTMEQAEIGELVRVRISYRGLRKEIVKLVAQIEREQLYVEKADCYSDDYKNGLVFGNKLTLNALEYLLKTF